MSLSLRVGVPTAGLLGALLLGLAIATSGGWQAVALALVILGALSLLALVAWMGPAYTLSLGLALTLFSGYWGNLGSPLPLDRLVFAIGFVSILMQPEMRREVFTRALRPVSLLLGALVLYSAASAWQAGTLGTSVGAFGLLDNLGLVPFVMYVLGPVAFRTRRDRDVLLTTLVAVGAYLGVTALFETLDLTALVFPSYISNPAIGIHFGRARGPFVEAVADGLALYACGVGAAIAMHLWKGQTRARLATIVAFLCAMGTVFTLTRSVWLATIVTTLLTLIAFRQTRRYFLPIAAAGLVVALATLVLIPGFAGKADQRGGYQQPVWDRLNTDAAALRMIEARPLQGFGWDTFESVGPEYMRQADTYPLTGAGLTVHNVFLARLSELGVIGTLLWLVAFATVIFDGAIRAGPEEMLPWRIGFVAIVISWLIVATFAPLTYPFSNLLLWLWAGLLSTSRRPALARAASAGPLPAAQG